MKKIKKIILMVGLVGIINVQSFSVIVGTQEIPASPLMISNVINTITGIANFVQTLFFGIETLQGLWETAQKVACTESEAKKQKKKAIEYRKKNVAYKRTCTSIDANATPLERTAGTAYAMGRAISNASKGIQSLQKGIRNLSYGGKNKDYTIEGINSDGEAINFSTQLDSVSAVAFESGDTALFTQRTINDVARATEEAERIATAVGDVDNASDWANINYRATANNGRLLDGAVTGIQSVENQMKKFNKAISNMLDTTGARSINNIKYKSKATNMTEALKFDRLVKKRKLEHAGMISNERMMELQGSQKDGSKKSEKKSDENLELSSEGQPSF